MFKSQTIQNVHQAKRNAQNRRGFFNHKPSSVSTIRSIASNAFDLGLSCAGLLARFASGFVHRIWGRVGVGRFGGLGNKRWAVGFETEKEAHRRSVCVICVRRSVKENSLGSYHDPKHLCVSIVSILSHPTFSKSNNNRLKTNKKTTNITCMNVRL